MTCVLTTGSHCTSSGFLFTVIHTAYIDIGITALLSMLLCHFSAYEVFVLDVFYTVVKINVRPCRTFLFK